jgi:hypothetical protein
MKKLIAIVLLIFFIGLLLAFFSRQASQKSESRELAQANCSTCHIFPEPDILPKQSWELLLGHMGYYLGITDVSYLEDSEFTIGTGETKIQYLESRLAYLVREGVFPSQPLINEMDWETVRSYYLESAPSVPISQSAKETATEMTQFRSLRTSYRISPPMLTTAIGIDEERGLIHLGDSFHESITTLSANGRVNSGPRRFFPPVTPIKIDVQGDDIFVGSIGDLFGSSTAEDMPGFIGLLTNSNQGIDNAIYTPIIGSLPRIADFLMLDLDQDGYDDFVTSGFGLATGLLTIHWGQEEGGFQVDNITVRAGAIKTQAADFNSDGQIDLAVLFGDAREGLFIYENLGNRDLRAHEIFATQPSYGHTYFEIHDFNQDGLMDLLVTNGDNVDSDPYNTLKNFHGIRIYVNNGNYIFSEDYFYPLHGAYRAQASDFDKDGDLDIAAIAFFPDFSLEEPESFVYLENSGATFLPFHDSLANSGRWMTMNTGDLNNDGYDDIVLGAAYIPLGMTYFMDRFQDLSVNGPGVVILRNLSLNNE